MSAPGYVLAGQPSELDRLRLQSRVWEPAGRALLARIAPAAPPRAVDVGCGALGWLRALEGWVGEAGEVVGTDVDDAMLAAARALVVEEGLANVAVVKDDLFDSRLPARSFSLVHARFQLAPLGRFAEQLAAYLRLARPGGTLVLEEPDSASWGFDPPAPAASRLVEAIRAAFRAAGGDFDAGLRLGELLRGAGLAPSEQRVAVALEAGHPYLELPLQFARALRPRLLSVLPEAELDALLADARAELARPGQRGTTFTLVQAWATVG